MRKSQGKHKYHEANIILDNMPRIVERREQAKAKTTAETAGKDILADVARDSGEKQLSIGALTSLQLAKERGPDWQSKGEGCSI